MGKADGVWAAIRLAASFATQRRARPRPRFYFTSITSIGLALVMSLGAGMAVADDWRDAAREMREMQREARRQQRDAERAAREAARDAEKAAKEAAKQAEQAAKEAAKQAAQAAKQAAQAAQQSSRPPTPSAPASTSNAGGANNQKTDSSSAKKNDNQKDDDDNDDGQDGRSSRRTTPAAPVEQGPPRSLAEMFARMMGNPPAADSDDADNSQDGDDQDFAADPASKVRDKLPATAKDSAGNLKSSVGAGVGSSKNVGSATKPPVQTAKTASKRVGQSRGFVDPAIDLPSLGNREFLATNINGASLEKLMALGFKARGARTFGVIDLSVTRLVPPASMTTAEAKAVVSEQVPGQSISQNRIYRPYRAAADAPGSAVAPASNQPCPSDRCYGLQVMHWSNAHRGCARAFRVGIVDTPVDLSHPTFGGRNISVGTFLAGAKPAADAAHGTGVLALLAGRPDGGTPGLLPDAHFYAADVFFADDSGQPMTDTVSLLKALDWLDASGVKVINMSVSGPRDDLVGKAISALASRGVIITAAAGNGGPSAAASYPAAYPEVISVTAIDRERHAYRHANHGGYIDLAAPGVGVWTAYPGAGEGPQTGTSFAVPFATAAIAAMYDSLGERNKRGVLRSVTVDDLGTPGQDNVYGRGLLLAPSPQCAPAPNTIASRQPAAAGNQAASAAIEVLPWAVPAAGPAMGFTEN